MTNMDTVKKGNERAQPLVQRDSGYLNIDDNTAQRSNEDSKVKTSLESFNRSKNIDIHRIPSDYFKSVEPFGTNHYFHPIFRMASSGKHILFFQDRQLFIIDGRGSIVKQLYWHDGDKFDACWSSALKKFILIGNRGSSLWLIDHKQDYPIAIPGK